MNQHQLARSVDLLLQNDTTAEIEMSGNDPTGWIRVKAWEWDAITDVRDAFFDFIGHKPEVLDREDAT